MPGPTAVDAWTHTCTFQQLLMGQYSLAVLVLDSKLKCTGFKPQLRNPLVGILELDA